MSTVVQNWGTGAVATEKGQDIPPGSTSSLPIRENPVEGRAQALLPLGTCWKLTAVGKGDGQEKNHSFTPLRRDKITPRVLTTAEGVVGEHKYQALET